ncbi:MAG: PEGA domain-containing protein [Candidatus Acidiferrales bacterium]
MRSKKLVVPLVALLLAGLLGPSASLAAPPQRRGSSNTGRTAIIRRVYVHPYYYHRYYYDPWYDPFWYRGIPYGYSQENLGTVQVKVKPSDGPKARLYINGALADEFKSKEKVRLKPGEYSVEVRKPGYESATRNVYVTAGKTLKLEFHLEQSG